MVLCVHTSPYNYMLIHLKLKVLLSWSDYMHVVLYKPEINVCHFFQDVNLDIVWPSLLSMSYLCLYR